MAAAICLAAVGIGVAIVQPGDMGDDTSAEETVGPDTDLAGDDDPVIDEDTSTDETDGTLPGDTGDTGEGDETTSVPSTSAELTRPTEPSTTSMSSSTTSSLSGMDAQGAATPNDTEDGLAETGGESLIFAGAALAATAIVIRRRSRSN